MLNVEDKKTSFTRIAPFTVLFDDGQYLKKKKGFFCFIFVAFPNRDDAKNALK